MRPARCSRPFSSLSRRQAPVESDDGTSAAIGLRRRRVLTQSRKMRKAALSLLVAAAAIAAPLASFGSFAQPANAPVTRAEVVAQLSRLELVGYEPFKSAYPDDMQAAEARVAEATGVGAGARRVERYRAVAACACASMPPGRIASNHVERIRIGARRAMPLPPPA
ncbi:DUF4148 domain-containing protein [Burkholderia multivorans]|uniref:DUF4148 domain-containing protein n=1 Tax=Burkholderia multivorans TaxID=87883 RepID=UPI001FC8D74F|nr:DUF4148 domain-containing protein [Burkholderia multivorans]MCA8335088.1 DUF4148 domain-containing protein [Burkholderia multivorans]UXZ59663.1 DUF4148 domain-containing protein [Burkholderia multivorans]